MPTVVTQIKTDRTNYSRYDPQARVITVTLYVTTPQAGTQLAVNLVRQDGYGIVATKFSGLLAGTERFVRVKFDLDKDCFDVFYPLIYRAKAGEYTVTCQAVTSPVFTISLVSLRRMRDEIVLGLPLLSSETVGVFQQPQQVTGVTIERVMPDILQKAYPLVYTNIGQTLSFAGGPAVAVGNGGTFILQDADGFWWVQVLVDDTMLPSVDTTESILISEMMMTDSAILAEIAHAEASVGDYLFTYLEPTQVATQHMHEYLLTHGVQVPPTSTYEDVIMAPVNYMKSFDLNNWYTVQLPVKELLQVEAFHGFFNNSEVVALDSAWWSPDQRSGMVALVPNQFAIVQWQAYSGFFYSFLMSSYDQVPNFWHFKATAGYPDLKGRRSNVLQAVEYTAAINVLRQAALYAKPGYTAENISRDGLSANVSYQQGIYGDTIKQYQAWLDAELPKIRQRRGGINIRFF